MCSSRQRLRGSKAEFSSVDVETRSDSRLLGGSSIRSAFISTSYLCSHHLNHPPQPPPFSNAIPKPPPNSPILWTISQTEPHLIIIPLFLLPQPALQIRPQLLIKRSNIPPHLLLFPKQIWKFHHNSFKLRQPTNRISYRFCDPVPAQQKMLLPDGPNFDDTRRARESSLRPSEMLDQICCFVFAVVWG